uniref:Uncharacterized protein n=1 Tax=Cacopsylla melanoneura TaxID=428564 RepID=A0A8D8V9D0_9HEMI
MAPEPALGGVVGAAGEGQEVREPIPVEEGTAGTGSPSQLIRGTIRAVRIRQPRLPRWRRGGSSRPLRTGTTRSTPAPWPTARCSRRVRPRTICPRQESTPGPSTPPPTHHIRTLTLSILRSIPQRWLTPYPVRQAVCQSVAVRQTSFDPRPSLPLVSPAPSPQLSHSISVSLPSKPQPRVYLPPNHWHRATPLSRAHPPLSPIPLEQSLLTLTPRHSTISVVQAVPEPKLCHNEAKRLEPASLHLVRSLRVLLRCRLGPGKREVRVWAQLMYNLVHWTLVRNLRMVRVQEALRLQDLSKIVARVRPGLQCPSIPHRQQIP